MIIVGGPHPTTSFKEVLNDKNIDVCVIGEGEATLAERQEATPAQGKLMKYKKFYQWLILSPPPFHR